PVHLQLLPTPAHAPAELPERRVLPRGVGREPPGAVGPPVVGEVEGPDLVPVVEGARAQGVGVVPAVPELPRPELLRLPAEVRLLRLAEPEGPVAQELGVPLGQAELPGDPGAAELPLPPIPAAVHGPVPGERGAVLAQEEGLYTLRRP